MVGGVPSPARSSEVKTLAAFPRCKKKTLRISDSRLQTVDSQLCRAEERLDEIRRARAQNLERQQALENEATGWLARREERMERSRRMDRSAARMQSVARGFFVRCFVVPKLRAEADIQELERSRREMQDKMLHMRQTIHDIHHLHPDRQRGALRLQSWWRSVLTRRVMDLLRIRTKVLETQETLNMAATSLQAVCRGNLGRQACVALRAEREREERLAQEEDLRMMASSVIKVQSLARRKFARRTTANRRRERAKEIKAAEFAETEAAKIAAQREDITSPSARRLRTRTKTQDTLKESRKDVEDGCNSPKTPKTQDEPPAGRPRASPDVGRRSPLGPDSPRARLGSDTRRGEAGGARYRSEQPKTPKAMSGTLSLPSKDASRWKSGSGAAAAVAKS